MVVEISKRLDGIGVLRCTRDDGTVTWQKQPRHGAHFALHDLTHYAVETTLQFSQGFFGLVASGWEIDETSGKGERGPLPQEALDVESIVSLLDSERASGAIWTQEEIREFGSGAARSLQADQVAAVRSHRADLFKKWAAVPPGEKLLLPFSLPRLP